MQIKSIDEIAKKWAQVTPMRSQDYADGIAHPRRSWAAATANATQAYNDGVTRSIQAGAFPAGVKRAGDAKWQRKASVEGVQRWGPGVAGAEGDYQAGFDPYQKVIAGLVLPPRYARRDPRNMARVTAIATALGQKKVQLMGGRG